MQQATGQEPIHTVLQSDGQVAGGPKATGYVWDGAGST